MREFHPGEDVLWPDGTQAGAVDRIVVDEKAHSVTHLVVDGRLVSLARLRDAGPDGLVLELDRAGFAKLPRLDHGHVVAPGEHWEAPSGHALSDFLAIAEALVGQSPYIPPVHAELAGDEVRQITVGSPVWFADEEVGEVERVLTGDRGALQELVVHRAALLGAHVRVPAANVIDVIGNNVHLDLPPEEVDKLPRYEPDEA